MCEVLPKSLHSDRILCISASCSCGCKVIFIHDDSQSDDMLLGHPWFPHCQPQWSGIRDGRNVSAVLYCTIQQSVSGLLLLQINIEVSGAPCCSLSACCLERREGRVTWELPVSSFNLAKLALHSHDFEDYCHSGVEDRVRCHDGDL